MKTIHIKNYIPLINGNMVNISDVPKLMSLIKELYKAVLKDDSKFHYFFEEDVIIIRISSENILDKVKEFLNNKSIQFEEYEYPFAPNGKFGEDPKGVTAKYLELFLPVMHAHSVAALTMSDEEHSQYLERVIHDAFNPKSYTYRGEGVILMKLAKLKLDIK